MRDGMISLDPFSKDAYENNAYFMIAIPIPQASKILVMRDLEEDEDGHDSWVNLLGAIDRMFDDYMKRKYGGDKK